MICLFFQKNEVYLCLVMVGNEFQDGISLNKSFIDGLKFLRWIT